MQNMKTSNVYTMCKYALLALLVKIRFSSHQPVAQPKPEQLPVHLPFWSSGFAVPAWLV